MDIWFDKMSDVINWPSRRIHFFAFAVTEPASSSTVQEADRDLFCSKTFQTIHYSVTGNFRGHLIRASMSSQAMKMQRSIAPANQVPLATPAGRRYELAVAADHFDRPTPSARYTCGNLTRVRKAFPAQHQARQPIQGGRVAPAPVG
jgi:hypothetical protein